MKRRYRRGRRGGAPVVERDFPHKGFARSGASLTMPELSDLPFYFVRQAVVFKKIFHQKPRGGLRLLTGT